ncbi:MAG: hypothetical protein ACJAT2_001602 [Bacteriovoracaceae bacterium]|jgi:hypothetical protein
MKELNVYDTSIQKEALINELKGNLFEFLVGQCLANSYGLEGEFLGSISPEFTDRLQTYELWLRENSPELLEKLPHLARSTAEFFKKKEMDRIDAILLVGKVLGGSSDQRAKEADLLLKKKDSVSSLSLKLCKENSFVNTKSAGARSFFPKYFSKSFPSARSAQNNLNHKLEEDYKEVSMALHEMAGLPVEQQFGTAWKEAGLPLLPGQLNTEMNKRLKEHYYYMIQSFYEVWENLYKKDHKKFKDSMMPLLGFGHKDLIQLSCFYSGDYQLSFNNIKKAQPYRLKLEEAVLIPPKEGLSSFEMKMEDCSFQIRLKPMNKFTVPGLKVNCSLKLLK